MKKLLLILLSLAVTTCVVTSVSACKLKRNAVTSDQTQTTDSEATASSGDTEASVPTHEHELSETYSFNETSHWRTCATCNELVGLEDHAMNWIPEVPVDGDTDGVVGHYECSVCGQWFGEDKSLLSEDEKVIKAHVVLTVKCYDGSTLLLTEERTVAYGERLTLTAPEIDYYDGSEINAETVIATTDREVVFKGYKRVLKILKGAASGNFVTVTAEADNTVALKAKAPAEGTITVDMVSGNTDRNGVIFNYNATEQGYTYYWFYARKSNATVNLAKVTDGNEELLYSNYLSADYNVNNSISEKIVLNGGKAYCYLWNTLITIYEVGETGGDYGFACDKAGAKFGFFPFSETATVEKVDTLLFGHSYFAWWNNRYYSNLAANMAKLEGIGTWADIGIGGSVAAHWNKYEPSIEAFEPTLGIYMIGINDITGSTSPSTVATDVEKLLTSIKEKLPEFKAVLLGVNRCTARMNITDKIAEVNKLYKTIAVKYDWINFADIEYAFCDESGNPIASAFSDGLHPTPDSFTNVITPAIASALKGENQPDYAEILAERKAAVLEKVATFEIEKYYANDQATMTCRQQLNDAATFDALDEAYANLFAAIRAVDNQRAVALMDAIFSDNSTKSSWAAVVANVKTWNHPQGTDYVVVNNEKEAGWQLTAENYYNFEMTVKIDRPTNNNPYQGYITKAYFIGAESNGNYAKGYAISIYKNGTDNWIQVHYADGSSTKVAGNFRGGVYIDLTDTEIKIVVKDGRLYICDIEGNHMSINGANGDPLGTYSDNIVLNGYVGGKIGIFSWDVTPKADTKMSITGFKPLEKSASEQMIINRKYVDSLNLDGWEKVDALVAEAAENATRSGQSLADLEEAYAALVAAVGEAYHAGGVAIMDAVFSNDNSMKSTWAAVVANVKSWTHVAGTDTVQTNSAKEAGWQITAQDYYNFEMTVKIDVPTPANPYTGSITKSFIFGAESNGNYPTGYAVTIYKLEGDNWIQFHKLTGNGTSVNGNFLGGRYEDFTDREVKIVVLDKKLYLYSSNGMLLTVAGANGKSLGENSDYIALDDYVGGKIGIFSWDVTPKTDVNMSITGFRALKKTSDQLRHAIDKYIASLNMDKWASVDILVSEAITNATRDGLSRDDLEEAYINLTDAVESTFKADGIAVLDAIFSDDKSEKSSWDAVVANVKAWTHTAGTDSVTINHSKAGWQLTKEKFYNFEMNVRMDVPTTHNPYNSTITNAYLIGASSNGNYPFGYAVIIYKNGNDNWIQVKYMNGNTTSGAFLGGYAQDFTDMEVKLVVEDAKLYVKTASGSPIPLLDSTLKNSIAYIPLDNYGTGGSIGFFTWTNNGATINDGTLHITGVRRYEFTAQMVQKQMENYLTSVKYDKWATNEPTVTAAVAAARASNLTYEQATAAYENVIAAVNASYKANGITALDAIFSDDNSEKSTWDAVVANVKAWTHTAGTDAVTIDKSKAGWQLTAAKYGDIELSVKFTAPTKLNPYNGLITMSCLIGANAKGSYASGYAITVYKNGSDTWLQVNYMDGTGVTGKFVGGSYGDFSDMEIKIIVSGNKISFFRADGSCIALVGTDLQNIVYDLTLDNYTSGSIGLFNWTNDNVTENATINFLGFRAYN